MPSLILSMLGLGKAALGFLARIPWQVYALAALVGFIAFLMVSRGHFMDRAHQDEARIAQFCSVVRIADHNPTLDCDHAEAQVELMGQALTNVTKALNDQTAAVNALGEKSEQQQSTAHAAVLKAQGRASEAEATAQRLAASSRSTPAPAASCGPSKALTEQWP